MDERALRFLTEAIEVIDVDWFEQKTLTLIRMIRFARARCYLAGGAAEDAINDLVIVSGTEQRELQIIAGTLSNLLQRDLPASRAEALGRVIEPLGFSGHPAVLGEMFGIAEVDDDMWSSWCAEVAKTMSDYISQLVPDTPLRTIDLLRHDGTVLPRSFRTPPAEQARDEAARDEAGDGDRKALPQQVDNATNTAPAPTTAGDKQSEQP